MEDGTKSKILFSVLGILIVGSVAVTYYKYMILRDYVIESQIDCDPYQKACFVWQCDPTSSVDGEACVNDPEVDTWYYELAQRNASKVPLCDPDKDENCDPWTCGLDEPECVQTFCDETTKLEQGVECSDPVKYTAEHPVEEETTSSTESVME